MGVKRTRSRADQQGGKFTTDKRTRRENIRETTDIEQCKRNTSGV